MKRKYAYITGLVVCAMLGGGFSSAPRVSVYPTDAPEIMNRMIASVDSLRTLQFQLQNWERIDGELLYGQQKVWMQVAPFRCYLYMIQPQRGSEILFNGTQGKSDMIYNPKGFPYMKMNIDPLGELARKNNHHTIFELGFSYFVGIMQHLRGQPDVAFTLEPEIVVEGTPCYVIHSLVKNYGYTDYTVREGEDLVGIARKKHLNEYMILELNKEKIDDYEDVKAGQRIRIPNAYAKWFRIAIDKKTYLPVEQKIFDESGLFEKYLMTNVKINYVIPQATFSESNLGRIK
ncbi:MAG: DUF1571 domain-containing protein [Flavobacteriales bacterium]|nr:DUF1571 domain-containing protein [Flavobacteriales bacterium]